MSEANFYLEQKGNSKKGVKQGHEINLYLRLLEQATNVFSFI